MFIGYSLFSIQDINECSETSTNNCHKQANRRPDIHPVYGSECCSHCTHCYSLWITTTLVGVTEQGSVCQRLQEIGNWASRFNTSTGHDFSARWPEMHCLVVTAASCLTKQKELLVVDISCYLIPTNRLEQLKNRTKKMRRSAVTENSVQHGNWRNCGNTVP